MSLGYTLRDRVVGLDDLVLDANNYRLSFDNDGKKYTDKEAESSEIQDATTKKLVKEKLPDLKESILENGFLEVDRIVVRKSAASDKYIVIEGNRRACAFKELIKEDKANKRKLHTNLKNKAKSINVIEITGDKEDIERYAATLMGIRHVSGPKKWPGIQSARLIYDLRKSGKKAEQIGALLGISGMDANRRLRGFLAYRQMKADSKFSNLVKKNHYTLLLEFLPIRNPIGKDWLGWDDKNLEFKNEKNRKRLYQALTKEYENGRKEINNPDEARLFLKALGIPDLKILIEQNKKPMQEFGPIVDDHNSKLIVEDFLRFLKRLDTRTISNVSEDLVAVQTKIEELLRK